MSTPITLSASDLSILLQPGLILSLAEERLISGGAGLGWQAHRRSGTRHRGSSQPREPLCSDNAELQSRYRYASCSGHSPPCCLTSTGTSSALAHCRKNQTHLVEQVDERELKQRHVLWDGSSILDMRIKGPFPSTSSSPKQSFLSFNTLLISFVVTEPEQGAPLASVASQLPASALSSSDNPTIRGSRLTRQASASTSTAESTDDNQSTISMSDSSNRPHSENHDRRRINRRRILFPPRLGKQRATELDDARLRSEISPTSALPTPPAPVPGASRSTPQLTSTLEPELWLPALEVPPSTSSTAVSSGTAVSGPISPLPHEMSRPALLHEFHDQGSHTSKTPSQHRKRAVEAAFSARCDPPQVSASESPARTIMSAADISVATIHVGGTDDSLPIPPSCHTPVLHSPHQLITTPSSPHVLPDDLQPVELQLCEPLERTSAPRSRVNDVDGRSPAR
ncbi:hypothetical protein PC9H_009137 [Pleurotus ostreatus]|uniref:Uncharacterized protein n=1 Tax=Pleurotus ostreatus TaxID=5322 RepID=A0A8H7DS99_PLEOS|nr:uncharacterized protein PC9H_009137 [Pleurotus ostreatus]KAF7426768.1 hypothetical protein PC9H_009137 [Pleurotus ostreatus]